jgi:hypothetical protein
MDEKITKMKLDEAERQRQLRVLREIAASSSLRSQTDVDKELAELRESRRSGGRRSPSY